MGHRIFKRALLALLLTAAALKSFAQTASPVAVAADAADTLRPLEVTVNGAKTGAWVLIERAGVLYAPKEAFDEWRVQPGPVDGSINVRGVRHFPLSAVAGFKSTIDFESQSLNLVFAPQSFAATRLVEMAAGKPQPDKVLPSVFLNYDLDYAASSRRDSPGSHNLGMLAELGVSAGPGVLTSTAVGRNLVASGLGAEPANWVRLETTFTRDEPNNNRTLRLGDATTRNGLQGLNVYFGGVQYGSNFALTPGFISQPLPSITGLSAAPSTVELYVNNVLRQVSSVPAGPFTLDNQPTFSGAGEARLVVRDLLGRETVVVQPFFSSPQLLAPQLDDWSVEAGALRRDLGSASGHYGPGFASATWRRGISTGLTLEGRTELTRNLRTFGLGAIAALPGQVLGQAAVTASHSKDMGSGVQWLVGADYIDPRASAAVQVQGANVNFRQLGQETFSPPTRLQVAANASYFTDNAGSFGVGFATLSRFDGPRVTTLSASYNIRIFERGNLTFSVGRAIAGGSGSNIGLIAVLPFENNIIATTALDRRSGETDIYTSAAKTPEQDGELGWRVLAGRQQGRGRAEGGVYYAGRLGRLTADASKSPDQTALRLGASGGLVWADNKFFASQRVKDSFALVEVAGYPDIGVSLGGQLQGRTDADGVALMPRLLAYQANQIRLDASELPINAELDSIEQIAVPAWRSGVKVVFPVRSGRGALLRIVFDDGDVAPAGALLQIEGDKQEFYVARRGEAFLTGLQEANRIKLSWRDQQCLFDAMLAPSARDEIPRVGPLVCKGVKR